jgi:6-pyruvoyltetrahydropterin/6-carboxytetrahydropterin synthase
MATRIYREYQLKFYLNARHYIVMDGTRGDIHPHTWEFSLNIRMGRGTFTAFHTFETAINACLQPYQNRILNEVEPFGEIVPTVENMIDYFAEQFRTIIRDIGGKLTLMSVSETPSRSYILDLSDIEDRQIDENMLSEVVDSVLDDLLDE